MQWLSRAIAALHRAEWPVFWIATVLALAGAGAWFRARLVKRLSTPPASPRERLLFPAIFFLSACLGPLVLGPALRLPAAIAGRAALFAPGWMMAYGALFGVVFAAWAAARALRRDPALVLDSLAPCLGVLVAGGRLGCTFAGCCFGVPHTGLFSLEYAPGTPVFLAQSSARMIPEQALSSLPVLPVPALEMGLGVAMAVLGARPSKRRGAAFAAVATLYAVGRFALQFLRDDPRPKTGPLDLPQWLSLIAMAGVLWWIQAAWKSSREP